MLLGVFMVMGTIGELQNLTMDKGLLLATCLAGLGQFGIYQVYYYNLRHFPVWIVKVFLLLMPIVAALVSLVLFSQKMEPNQIAGMVIVLGGALGILYEQKKKSEKTGTDVLKER